MWLRMLYGMIKMNEHLLGYAERRLGKSLSDSDKEEIKHFTLRRQIRDWAMSKKAEPISKPIKKIEPKKITKPKKAISKKESVKVEQSVIDIKVKKEEDTDSE